MTTALLDRLTHRCARCAPLPLNRWRTILRALDGMRRQVNLTLTKAVFIAALPWEAHSARLTFRGIYPTAATALQKVVRPWRVTRRLGPKWPWPADPAFTATRVKPLSGQGFAGGVFREGGLIGTVAVIKGEPGLFVASRSSPSGPDVRDLPDRPWPRLWCDGVGQLPCRGLGRQCRIAGVAAQPRLHDHQRSPANTTRQRPRAQTQAQALAAI